MWEIQARTWPGERCFNFKATQSEFRRCHNNADNPIKGRTACHYLIALLCDIVSLWLRVLCPGTAARHDRPWNIFLPFSAHLPPLPIRLFISPYLCSQDWLIETCIIHPRVLAVIAGLISKQRGAQKQSYNQSTGGLTPATMGYVDWMSG